MRTINTRVRNLEKHFGTGAGQQQQILLIVCKAGWGLALDQDRCIRILGETGFLPTGRIGLVNVGHVPNGLNAEQTEIFLREHAAEICGIRGAQNDGGAASA